MRLFPTGARGEAATLGPDFGLSAFAMFFMQSASFLAYQRTMEKGHGRSNCQTLFGIGQSPPTITSATFWTRRTPRSCCPVSNVWRRVDRAADAASLRPAGRKDLDRLGRNGVLLLAETRLPALPDAQARQRQDRELSYYAVGDGRDARPLQGRAVGAGIHRAPGRRRKAGLRTQRRQALVRQHGARLAPLRPVFLGDDLFACHPVAKMITDAGDDFIFTCKPTSHKTLYDFIDGAEFRRHEEKVRRRNTKETLRYRWIEAVLLRDGKDAILVNWIAFEIVDAKGKVKYSMAWVTSLPVSKDNVAEIVACGRRWKIENESFNVAPARRRRPSGSRRSRSRRASPRARDRGSASSSAAPSAAPSGRNSSSAWSIASTIVGGLSPPRRRTSLREFGEQRPQRGNARLDRLAQRGAAASAAPPPRRRAVRSRPSAPHARGG